MVLVPSSYASVLFAFGVRQASAEPRRLCVRVETACRRFLVLVDPKTTVAGLRRLIPAEYAALYGRCYPASTQHEVCLHIRVLYRSVMKPRVVVVAQLFFPFALSATTLSVSSVGLPRS